eukprot:6201292-Pleurochrysis_carterae.AAC.2
MSLAFIQSCSVAALIIAVNRMFVDAVAVCRDQSCICCYQKGRLKPTWQGISREENGLSGQLLTKLAIVVIWHLNRPAEVLGNAKTKIFPTCMLITFCSDIQIHRARCVQLSFRQVAPLPGQPHCLLGYAASRAFADICMGDCLLQCLTWG